MGAAYCTRDAYVAQRHPKMGAVAGRQASVANAFPAWIGGCDNASMKETKLRDGWHSQPIKGRLRSTKRLPGDF